MAKQGGVLIKGRRCFVEIERNQYLPATPENIAKAKQARFLEDLREGKATEAEKDLREDKCKHIVFWDDPDSYMYIERYCIDCGVCFEMI